MSRLVSPSNAEKLIRDGAVLIDIRETDEHRRERIIDAINCPVSELESIEVEGNTLIFHCKSGSRTASHAERLGAKAGGRQWLMLDGGIEGWKRGGLPVMKDTQQPIELQRQVMIAAGSLVLLGILLSVFVSAPFLWLSAFVGSGLVFAGISGFCGMAKLLMLAPWNLPRKA